VPVATVPLGAGCTVCKREDVEAINAALASRAETGDGLRALGDRYGVSKATLSRHLNHGK